MRAKGLLLAAIQLSLALSVAGKYGYDRATLPRAWARVAPADPHLPIRGRYVRLQVVAEAADREPDPPTGAAAVPVRLTARDGKLLGRALEKAAGTGYPLAGRVAPGGYQLREPLAFFLPPGIPDPSIRAQGEELWVEVSVPAKGAPRPVRLGVKKGADHVPNPLDIR